MDYTFPPEAKGIPILGRVLSYFREWRDTLAYFTQLERTYGPMTTIKIGDLTMVFATQASAVRNVLIENASNFTNREVYAGLVLLLGDGLLTSDGDFHKQQRRLVMPAFHKHRVESYGDIMVNFTQQALEAWRPGQNIDMAREMRWLTLRIVAKALFNVDLKDETSELGQAFASTLAYINGSQMASLQSLRIDLPFTAYGRFKRAKALLDKVVYQMIADHRANDYDSGDVLSTLLQAQDDDGVTLSDIQIRDQTMTLLAAGHATTANALTWTFYLLSEHPEVRAKLLQEIWETLGDRPPAVADLERMPYLEMVVKESMRLYPPAWAIMRRATQDFDLEGYHLPGGVYVVLSQYVTHRLPQYWTRPEEFWPERFDSEPDEPREAFAYFPFGAGPRTCIGMPFAMLEARLLLTTVLQRFTPNLAPDAQVVPHPMITLGPKYGMPMILQRSPQLAENPTFKTATLTN